MRIKIKRGSSYKDSPNFESEQELKEVLKLDSVENYDVIVSALNSGLAVFGFIDPYRVELMEERMLRWEYTQYEADLASDSLADDI